MIQIVKEYEINLSEKGWYYVAAKISEYLNAYLFQKSLTEQIVDAFPVLKRIFTVFLKQLRMVLKP